MTMRGSLLFLLVRCCLLDQRLEGFAFRPRDGFSTAGNQGVGGDGTRSEQPTSAGRQTPRGVHGNITFVSVLAGFGKLLKVLLGVGTNLDDSARFDQGCDFLPALAMLFEALEEQTVLFGGPATRIFAHTGVTLFPRFASRSRFPGRCFRRRCWRRDRGGVGHDAGGATWLKMEVLIL